MDRPQDSVDIAVEASELVGIRWPAGGEREQRPLAALGTGFVDVAPAVNAPHREYPIHPALEYRRQSEPPQRELPNHQFTPRQLVEFFRKDGCKTVGFGSVGFLNLRLEVAWILGGEKICPAGTWIEIHRIQIRQPHGMTGCGECGVSGGGHGSVETFRFRVSVDDQNVHSSGFRVR